MRLNLKASLQLRQTCPYSWKGKQLSVAYYSALTVIFWRLPQFAQILVLQIFCANSADIVRTAPKEQFWQNSALLAILWAFWSFGSDIFNLSKQLPSWKW